MTRLIYLFVFSGLSLVLNAQVPPHENRFFFEAESGVSKYDVISVPVVSFQLHVGSVVNEFFGTGLFLNGYTATGAATTSFHDTVGYAPIPHGFRAGVFLRACTSAKPNVNHAYAEFKGSVGYMFQSGMMLKADDTAMEFLGGMDIGYNISMGSDSYFGIYLGAETGFLNFKDDPLIIGGNTNLLRYNFGLRFQKRY